MAEEGAAAADHLLTMAIRAIDYCPATDIAFPDYLSALLTADRELYPDDSKYGYREVLRSAFVRYGILPASDDLDGCWRAPEGQALSYEQVHAQALRRNPDEVFRFLWDNREALALRPEARTQVLSVLPCRRSGPDGFPLNETVAQYIQELDLLAADLTDLSISKPATMADDEPICLVGGGALIFDDFGQLKYHVHKDVLNAERQSKVLAYSPAPV